MKYTLLELTQSILRSMESDEVSSIGETPESTDVANIIKECFFDIVGHQNLAEHEGLFKLDASTDNLKPVLMYMPTNLVRLDWLKYNTEDSLLGNPDVVSLRHCTQEEFIFHQHGLNTNEIQIGLMSIPVNGNDFTFKFRNDRFPSYYTIFDERSVVFDAYDRSIEDTLTTNRTVGFGLLAPGFQMEDTFIPDLDHRQFQLLLNDAKSVAAVELKQAPNPKAEQKYRRNIILAQKTRNDNAFQDGSQARPSYGRKNGYPRRRY